MEYTIQKLSRLAGISTRTLRYYDEIGLLKPAKINSSGYRIYGTKETDQLQLILFYRALDLSLDEIRTLILAPDFDRRQALANHLQSLLSKRNQLDQLITNVENTLLTIEGSMTMTDQEKFEGLKRTLVDENEKTFGAEVRKLYGDKAIDEAHQALLSRSKQEHDSILALEQEVLSAFKTAYENGEGSAISEAAYKAAKLHQAWLKAHWPSYSACGHRAIAETYVTDARFSAYYDRVQPVLAQFVRDVILSCIKD